MRFIMMVLAAFATHSHKPVCNHACHERRWEKKLEAKYEPYYGCTELGGCSKWAVPACIVNAESKGLVHEASHVDYSSGLYQIEANTWAAYGGQKYTQLAYAASKLDQSIIASKIWAGGRGASQWETAEGCGY
jgi:hypothetical protein